MSNASKITGQLARQGSQGSKVVQCVACKGDIQPYAGRPVSLYSNRYAHHPGDCQGSKPGLASSMSWQAKGNCSPGSAGTLSLEMSP